MKTEVELHKRKKTKKKHGIGRCFSLQNHIPSGKPTKNYGKSPFLLGKSTINGNFQ